jgi:hypothetical protein
MTTSAAIKSFDFPIVGSFHADKITKISAERTINWYEVMHPFGKKQTALHPTQGTKLQTQIGILGGPVRGSLVVSGNIPTDDKAYFCSNNQLFQMDTSFIVTQLGPGTFGTTTGYVDIAANQTQIVFIDGVTGFLWDTVTSTLSPIAFPAGVIPNSITYMDGYFIITDSVTNRFYVSALDNGATWNALSFASINSSPTFAKGVMRLKRRLFIFGTIITEVWLDAGTSNFPFRRDNNLLFEHGLESQGSLVEGFDRVFYLSRDEGGVGAIKMIEGTVPEDISTYEIDNAIQALSQTNLAVGMVYKIDGIIFYKITVGGRTFVYNVTMSSAQNRIWHEEEMLDGSRHIANTHIFFNNAHYIGAYNSANLYQYATNFLDNNGEAIHRTRISHVLSNDTYKRIRIDRLQIDMLQGVGIPGTDNTDFDALLANKDQNPTLKLSISADGGVTYLQLPDAEIGKTGNRIHRTIWRTLGVRYDHIVKVETWNSVPCYMLGAAIYGETLPL